MRVVIAEDLTLLRDGLIRLFEANGFTIEAAVDNEADLREALQRPTLDVAVVDVRLPPTFTDEGLRAAIEARVARPALPIVVLSQYVEQLYARELLSGGQGAIGYLLKDRVTDVGDFIRSVRQVAEGGTVMDPEVISALVASRSRTNDPLTRLSPRELEALGYMAEGRSNAAIGGRMVISEKAVSKHINSLFTKLDLPPDDDDNRRVLAVLTYLRGS
jgi:DNA-binding NarL/FixJ family response regulator